MVKDQYRPATPSRHSSAHQPSRATTNDHNIACFHPATFFPARLLRGIDVTLDDLPDIGWRHAKRRANQHKRLVPVHSMSEIGHEKPADGFLCGLTRCHPNARGQQKQDTRRRHLLLGLARRIAPGQAPDWQTRTCCSIPTFMTHSQGVNVVMPALFLLSAASRSNSWCATPVT